MYRSMLFSLMLVVCLAGAGWSTTYHSGDFRNLGEAVLAGADGDTVLVAPGVYRQSFSIQKQIVLTSEAGPKHTFLVPRVYNSGICAVALVPGGTCEISGFTFTYDFAEKAVWLAAGSLLLRDNVFVNNSGATVGKPVILADTATSLIMYRNLIHHNAAEYALVCNAANATIINNTFDNCARALRINSPNAIVRNNIFTSCSVYGIYAEQSISSADYNCFYDNTADYLSMTSQPNDVLADPVVVDQAASDYRLNSTSPCIDAGDPDPVYRDPDNSRADIGYAPYDGYTTPVPTFATVTVPFDYPTIGEAVDAAVTGDTIRIMPGNYHENIFIDTKSLTIIGETSGYDTVMVMPADTTFPTLHIDNGANDTRVSGMHFIGAWGRSAILVTNGSPRIDHNGFVNNYSKLQENSILAAYDIPSSHPRIDHNLFAKNPADYTVWIPADSADVINNTVASCVRGIGMDSPKSLLLNNIVTGCSFYGLGVNHPPLLYDYNCVWNNTKDDYFENVNGPNDLSADPLFINPDLRVYTLVPTSPCIDAGSPDASYDDSDGSRNDVGAFSMSACCQGSAGDVNGDGYAVDPVDLSYLVDYLFASGPAPWCEGEADVNGDAASGDNVDMSYLLDLLFAGGPPAAACP